MICMLYHHECLSESDEGKRKHGQTIKIEHLNKWNVDISGWYNIPRPQLITKQFLRPRNGFVLRVQFKRLINFPNTDFRKCASKCMRDEFFFIRNPFDYIIWNRRGRIDHQNHCSLSISIAYANYSTNYTPYKNDQFIVTAHIHMPTFRFHF